METGTVSALNIQERYGFVTTALGEEIFFHFDNGRQLQAAADRARWMPTAPSRDPRLGDHLLFERTSGSKRPKARPWGLCCDFEQTARAQRRDKVLVHSG